MCIDKEKMVQLNRPRESGRLVVPVDDCIADTVQQLNDIGIHTLGCCCGHGKGEPHVLIDANSEQQMISLGYKVDKYLYNDEDLGTRIVFL